MEIQLLGVSTKLLMLEDGPVQLVSDFVKVVHVELSDEGTEVPVPEIDGKNFLLESFNIKDNKAGSLLTPRDNSLVSIGLNKTVVTSRIW
jgi:hypothetical protein